MTKLDQAISSHSAQRIYDAIGKRYDWFGSYEAHAKERSIELLELSPGLRLLEVGVGTGSQHLHIQDCLRSDGMAVGIDLSWVMLKLTRQRCTSPLCQADTHQLPFQTASFDRLYAAYVLDLLPQADLPGILIEFHRVLKEDGQIVLLALTEGVNFSSRLLVGLWKGLYTISPLACAGCRPLQLSGLFDQAGFHRVERQVVVQMGMPSELISAWK